MILLIIIFFGLLFIFNPVGLTIDSLIYYFQADPFSWLFQPSTLIALFIIAVASFIIMFGDTPNFRG